MNLPVAVYRALKGEIEDKLAHRFPKRKAADEYVPFVLEDHVDNPVDLARDFTDLGFSTRKN